MSGDIRERALFLIYQPGQIVNLGPAWFEASVADMAIDSVVLVNPNTHQHEILSNDFIGWEAGEQISTSVPKASHPVLALDTRHSDFDQLRRDPEHQILIHFAGGAGSQYRLALQATPEADVRAVWTEPDEQADTIGSLLLMNGTGKPTQRYLEVSIKFPNDRTLPLRNILGKPRDADNGRTPPYELIVPDNTSPLTGAHAGEYGVIGPIDLETNQNLHIDLNTSTTDATYGAGTLYYALAQHLNHQVENVDISIHKRMRAELEKQFSPSPTNKQPDTYEDTTLEQDMYERPTSLPVHNNGGTPILPSSSVTNGAYQPHQSQTGPDAAPNQPELPKANPKRSIPRLFGNNGLLGDWRVGLLAITGLALSIASGITTWDGMTNFTNNAGLSFLITFGIQGVMLIAAFIIGKTFVDGLRTFDDEDEKPVLRDFIKTLFGLFLLVAFVGVSWVGLSAASTGRSFSEVVMPIISAGASLSGIIAVIAFVALLLTAFRNVPAVRPYIGGLSIMAANLPLWAMFLICMGISVFFSFDSLFNQILPQDARVANANIRMQAEVPDLLQSIRTATQSEQVRSQRALLNSKGWNSLNTTLNALAAEAEIAQQNIRQEEDRRIERQSKRQAQNKAAIETSQFQITQRKSRIAGINAQLEQSRVKLAAIQKQVTAAETRLAAQDAELRVAQAASEAEARGVDGTGKAGRGPAWRALREEEKKIEFRRDLAAGDVKRAKAGLSAIEAETNTLLAAQSKLIEERLQFEERMTVAQQKSGLTEEQRTAQLEQNFSGALSSLPVYRERFLKNPTRTGFTNLQGACKVLLTGLKEQNNPSVADKNCELNRAVSTAQKLFTLNSGLTELKSKCPNLSAATKLNADQLIGNAQTCLDVSGLTGKAAKPYRDRLKTLKLSRDDQANNFVVTLNSFSDGNRLAYLALGIAIAIDLLVFMSGLFGARVGSETGITSNVPPKLAFARELRPIGNETSSEANYAKLADGIKPFTNLPEDGGVWTHYVPLENERKPVIRRVILTATAHDWVRNDGQQLLLHKNAWQQICEGREIARQWEMKEAHTAEVDVIPYEQELEQTPMFTNPANDTDPTSRGPEPRTPKRKSRTSGNTPIRS